MVETDEKVHKQIWEAAIQGRVTNTHVNLHVTDWVAAQWEDPVFKATINWIPNQKVQDLKHLLGDYTNTREGLAVLQEWEKLMLYKEALYHHYTVAGEQEEVLHFIVPMAH